MSLRHLGDKQHPPQMAQEGVLKPTIVVSNVE